jgi:DNA-binding protein HU-beta
MTPAQMAVYLLDKAGISKVQAKATLDELSTLTVRELKREGTRLAGLGIFRKPARPRLGFCRNPTTGEQIKIPARTRLRFTPPRR